MDALKPTPGLLCKIVSVIVHADELREPGAHEFDKVALEKVLDDPEVKEWVEAMTKAGFAPIKRSRPATEPREDIEAPPFRVSSQGGYGDDHKAIAEENERRTTAYRKRSQAGKK
jgi:hypothetical protein